MTKVIIVKSNNIVKGFICSGHSGYARRGQDIVCSAVSILTINTINSIEQIAKLKPNVEKEDGNLSCFLDETNDKADVLIGSYILGLQSIVKNYGSKYLQVEFQEV